jgi:hypothetical protein
MTTSAHDRSVLDSTRGGWAPLVLVPEMWATLSIVVMWLAVLFVGIDGGQATFHSVDSSVTTIPAGVLVAIFAALGTGSVAKRMFGRPRSEQGR